MTTTTKRNHFIRMSVENGSLEQYGFEAGMVAIECDDNTWIYRAVLTNRDEDRLVCQFWSGDVDAEFASMPEAIEWLHGKAREAVVKACKHKAWIGREAQNKIDDISEYGFDL